MNKEQQIILHELCNIRRNTSGYDINVTEEYGERIQLSGLRELEYIRVSNEKNAMSDKLVNIMASMPYKVLISNGIMSQIDSPEFIKMQEIFLQYMDFYDSLLSKLHPTHLHEKK